MKTPGALIPVFLFCAIMLFPVAAPAREQAKAFLDAVDQFEAGKYQAAAEGFLSIAGQGVVNGKLYYNIANACLKSGDIGRAVLWYEKARRLMPNDPDLRFNLEYARSQVKDKAPEVLSLPEMLFFWRTWLGQKTVVVLAAVFSLVFCLTLLVKKYFFARTPAFICYGALGFFLFFFCTGAGKYYFDRHLRQGVVLVESISAKSGFSDLSTELFVLHAGSRVTIEQEKDHFYRIRFDKDKSGWVHENEIGII